MPRPERRNPEQFDDWIVSARARLAARKNIRPTTKSGAIRALWPEIQQALHNGQTLKTIRDWLEAEGVTVRYNQLTTYVSRLRKKAKRVAEAPSHHAVVKPNDITIASAATSTARDPLANLRSQEGRVTTFHYDPKFNEEDLT